MFRSIPDTPLSRKFGRRMLEEADKCSLLGPEGGQVPRKEFRQTKLADTLFVAHALIEDQTGHRVIACSDYAPAIDPKLSPEIAKQDVLKRVEFLHPGTKPLDIAVYRVERLIGV